MAVNNCASGPFPVWLVTDLDTSGFPGVAGLATAATPLGTFDHLVSSASRQLLLQHRWVTQWTCTEALRPALVTCIWGGVSGSSQKAKRAAAVLRRPGLSVLWLWMAVGGSAPLHRLRRLKTTDPRSGEHGHSLADEPQGLGFAIPRRGPQWCLTDLLGVMGAPFPPPILGFGEHRWHDVKGPKRAYVLFCVFWCPFCIWSGTPVCFWDLLYCVCCTPFVAI